MEVLPKCHTKSATLVLQQSFILITALYNITIYISLYNIVHTVIQTIAIWTIKPSMLLLNTKTNLVLIIAEKIIYTLKLNFNYYTTTLVVSYLKLAFL